MLLQASLTSTARTRIHVSLQVVQIQLWRMADTAATPMRIILGCGSLGVASLAWVAWQSRREQRDRMLPTKHQTNVGRRLVEVAMMVLPDWKWSVSVIYVTVYWFTQSTYRSGMYWTKQCFPEIEWEVIYLTLGCGKRLGMWNKYLLVPKHLYSPPFPR
jgi:hypothetical protein